ncbi:MAG: hypothetical protein EOL97_07040 [Spirochaetia bacterium]|nr:hypothetical protein [Spirochaetia bacterium]
MKKYFSKTIYIFLFISFFLIITISCDIFYLEESKSTAEKKLINDGYTRLIDDDIEGFWYKNINNEVTRYILEEEYLHSSQYYLDAYFFIDVEKNNEAKLKIKSRTNSRSSEDMFIPKYVTYQPYNYHSTSSEDKITLVWGDVDFQTYTGNNNDYFLWCDSIVINDDDKTINALLKLFDSNEEVYFYFSNDYKITKLKKLNIELLDRIRKTFEIYSKNKQLLTYHTPGNIPLINTIKFYANGGEGKMEDITANLNESIILPKNNFLKRGYTFLGWATSKDGEVICLDESEYTMNAIGINLYAKWSPNTNKITFHPNYLNDEETLTQTINTDDSQNLKSNTFKREGYCFAGWSLNKEGSIIYKDEEVFTMGTDNVDLYAQWRIKLESSDSKNGDLFGRSLDVYGDYAIIGCSCGDGKETNTGIAYIFHYDQQKKIWEQQQKIFAKDGSNGDLFGYSVCISGKNIIIGSPHDDDNGYNSGSTYIYKIGNSSDETMNSERKIISANGISYEEYGYSVGISETNIIIGSRIENGTGKNYGKVYVYELSNALSSITASEQQITIGNRERFGWDVDICNSRIIVGASFGDGSTRTSGVAYIFDIGETIDDTRKSIHKIFASDGNYLDLFGETVAIDENYVIIGSIYNDEIEEQSGSAYIYNYNSSKNLWENEQKIYPSDGDKSDFYGSSVDISEDKIIIGARNDDDNGNNSGSAYLYTISNDKNLTMESETKKIPFDGKQNDSFGVSVALYKNIELVGTSNGSVYVYD